MKQTPGWKLDTEIKQKIDEKLCTNVKLKEIIDWLRQEAKRDQEKTSKLSTPAEASKEITRDVADKDKDYLGKFWKEL